MSKDKLVKDLGDDKLACPKDLVCVMDVCLGQTEGSNNFGYMDPYCRKVDRDTQYQNRPRMLIWHVRTRLSVANATQSHTPTWPKSNPTT